MSWSQTRSPNLSTAGNIGFCLSFVEAAYGTPHLYPTALAAWENAGGRHEDENFPEGMYVPIYFTYESAGHIAIRKPDGSILSSPWEQGTHQATLPDIAELIRIYSDNGVHPMTCLGWSESLAGVQLVEYTAPAPVAPPFTLDIQPFSGQFIVRGNKWNLDLPNFNAIAGSPIASPPNTPITFTAQLKRSDLPQYTYYLEDSNVHQGYNSLDCVPYTPPPTKPYVAPQGAASVTKAETYTLVTALPCYATLDAIANTKAASGTIPAGTYYVWAKGGNSSIYYELSATNTNNDHKWVNILNNVPPKPAARESVTVEPITAPSMTTAEIRASYRSIPDGPMDVSAKTNILVTDIVSSGSPVTVKAGTVFHIYGTFRKNSQWYASPKIAANDAQAGSYLYGVPISSSTSLDPFLEAAYGYPERISYGFQAFYDRTIATIEGIFRATRRKS